MVPIIAETGDKTSALSSLKKKRGIVKRSITRLVKTLKTLEATPHAPRVVDLVTKLEGLDKDFRSVHYDIVDLFEEDSEDLEKEHEVLDKHEDDVTATSLRLQKLITLISSTMDTGGEKTSSRKLSRIERHLKVAKTMMTSPWWNNIKNRWMISKRSCPLFICRHRLT